MGDGVNGAVEKAFVGCNWTFVVRARCMKRLNMSMAIAARHTTPPTTPPTIALTFILLL